MFQETLGGALWAVQGTEAALSLPIPWSGGGEISPMKGEQRKGAPKSLLCRGACLSPRDQGNENAEKVNEVETRPALEQAQSDVYSAWMRWDGMRSSSQSQHQCLSCLWVEGRRGSSCRWANFGLFPTKQLIMAAMLLPGLFVQQLSVG